MPRKSPRIANANAAPAQKGAPAARQGTKRERQDDAPPAEDARPKPKRSKKTKRKALVPPEIREPGDPPRLKRFRLTCPHAVAERWDRMRVQRMFCLGRQRDEPNLTEEFKIAGSTGNIYTVVVRNVPACDCPDGRKHGTCKHILFVMSRVLRVRDGLAYQAALLNSEIREIFAKAPEPMAAAEPVGPDGRQRKPLEQDECPICYEAFNRNETDVVYCVAQCGTNIHKDCFRQWAATRGGGAVTCVMCRAPWEKNPVGVGEYGQILQDAKIGAEGYLNVANEMGISPRRDTSTYYTRFYDSRRYRWL
ncbi:hypothetical protein TWF696_007840 [Orbilia brochopaga]|uniref:Uncharacterized protein n=1 Tax=Orbilia brochopaga TaxID=3140254 RepID=A0AAV9UMG9_9PEZI